MSVQSEPVLNILFSERELKVAIGEVCCSIKCSDSEIFDYLKNLYRSFLSDKPAEFFVELEVAESQKETSELDKALSETAFSANGNRAVADNIIFEYEYDSSSRTLYLKMERGLFDPKLDFTLMNRVVPPAYYTVCETKYNGRPPEMLVHCSGIIRDGQVFLFSGPSGIGKTTAARLCSEKHAPVMNDEMLFVSRPQRENGICLVKGAPIAGKLSQKLNTTAPLICVFMLKQSHRTRARRMSRIDAYLSFMRQIISPEQLGKANKREMYSLLAEFSDEISGAVPFYEMEFTLDADSLWNEIGNVQKALLKGG